MMFQSPKSVTATVHLKFNYGDRSPLPVTDGDIEALNKILDKAGEMSPEHRELLVKFTYYINGIFKEGQHPS